MSPIIIFAYLRSGVLDSMLQSLCRCEGFAGRACYAFVDGLKTDASEADRAAHAAVLEVLQHCGFDLNLSVSPTNKGLARSVFEGVSAVLSRHESAIILEDDLLLAPDFLTFMDECIEAYRHRQDIYSISGFCHQPQTHNHTKGVFLFPRPGSWGWATWANRWQGFQLNAIDRKVLNDAGQMNAFNDGGKDLSWMLRRNLDHKVNSWAVQWAWYQFLNRAYSVYPDCSKVENTGFGEDATHTRRAAAETNGSMGNICTDKLLIDAGIQVDINKIKAYRGNYPLGKLSALKEKCLRWLGR